MNGPVPSGGGPAAWYARMSGLWSTMTAGFRHHVAGHTQGASRGGPPKYATTRGSCRDQWVNGPDTMAAPGDSGQDDGGLTWENIWVDNSEKLVMGQVGRMTM